MDKNDASMKKKKNKVKSSTKQEKKEETKSAVTAKSLPERARSTKPDLERTMKKRNAKPVTITPNYASIMEEADAWRETFNNKDLLEFSTASDKLRNSVIKIANPDQIFEDKGYGFMHAKATTDKRDILKLPASVADVKPFSFKMDNVYEENDHSPELLFRPVLPAIDLRTCSDQPDSFRLPLIKCVANLMFADHILIVNHHKLTSEERLFIEGSAKHIGFTYSYEEVGVEKGLTVIEESKIGTKHRRDSERPVAGGPTMTRYHHGEVGSGLISKVFDVNILYSTEKDWYLKRAVTETETGHFMRAANTIIALRIAFGFKKSQSLFAVRLLKTYVDQILEGGEGFRSDRSGVVITGNDVLCPLRIIVLTNLMFEEMNLLCGEMPADPELLSGIREAGHFMFRNPQHHSFLLKDWITPYVQSVCADPPTVDGGTALQYPQKELRSAGFVLPNICGRKVVGGDRTDKVYLDWMHKVGAFDAAPEFEEALPLYSALWTSLLTAKVEPRAYRRTTILRKVQAYAGYNKQLTPEVQKADAAPERDPDFSPTAEFIQFQKQFHHDAIMNAYGGHTSTTMAPDMKLYFNQLQTVLTSNSAGGPKATFKVLLNKTKEAARGLQDYLFSSTSKLWVFLTDGASHLVPEAFKHPMRGNYCGFGGTRSVPGAKKQRLIYARPLFTYLGEMLTSRPMMNRQMQYDEVDDPMNHISPNRYRTGKDTGVLAADHGAQIFSTGAGIYLHIGTDFSAYDKSCYWPHRVPAREAMMEALAELNNPASYGAHKTIAEELMAVWSEDFLFNTEYLITDGTISYLIKVDYTSSGELATLSFNSYTNNASTSSGIVRAYKFGVQREVDGKIKFVNVVGDDGLIIMQKPDVYNVDVHDKLVRWTVESHKENNLDVNLYKTLVRVWATELVQVSAMYGRYIPKDFIQGFGSEGKGRTEDNPIALFSSEAGKWNTKVARGCCPELVSRIIAANWMLRGSTKFRLALRTRDFMYLPMIVLYTPKRSGGVGLAPFTSMFAAADGLLYSKATPEILNMYLIVQGAMKKRRVFRDLVTSSITSGNTDPPNVVKTGKIMLEKALHGKRIKASWIARKELQTILPPDHSKISLSLAYANMPKRMLAKQIEGSTEMVQAAKIDRANFGDDILENLKEKAIGGLTQDAEALFGITVRKGDDVTTTAVTLPHEDLYQGVDHAMPVLANRLWELVSFFGFSAEGEFIRSPGVLFGILARDPYWRRDVTVEQLFTWLSDPVLNSESAVIHFLIYLGAHPDSASKVAESLTMAKNNFLQKELLNFMSLVDRLIPNLNLDQEAVTNAVAIDGFVNNRITTTLYLIGISHFLYDFVVHGSRKRVHVGITSQGLLSLLQYLNHPDPDVALMASTTNDDPVTAVDI